MYNPNDDPDVISGLCDDAKKEMTHPGPSQLSRAQSRVGSGPFCVRCSLLPGCRALLPSPLAKLPPPGAVHCLQPQRPLDLPFGVVARFLSPLPLHLSPYSQEH